MHDIVAIKKTHAMIVRESLRVNTPEIAAAELDYEHDSL